MSSEPSEFYPTPTEAAAYLENIVGALRDQVLPHVELDSVRQRLNETMDVLARLSVGFGLSVDGSPMAGGATEGEGFARLNAMMRSMTSASREASGSGRRRIGAEELRTYMAQHVDGAKDIVIEELVHLAGGRSKDTYLVKQSGCGNLPADIVIRQDGETGILDGSVKDEFPIIQYVADNDLRVAAPLYLEPQKNALGNPFMIVERAKGRPHGGFFEPPFLPDVTRQFASQLGKLHALHRNGKGAPPASLHVKSYGAEALRQELAGIRAIVEQLSKHTDTLPAAVDWLERHIDKVDGEQVLVHGDCGFHNFLATDKDFTALLDWELAHFGNPAEDLGYARFWITQNIPWQEFLDIYYAAGAPRSSDLAVDFYTLWGDVRVCSILLRARAGIVSRQVKDFELTIVGGHFLYDILARVTADFEAIRKIHP